VIPAPQSTPGARPADDEPLDIVLVEGLRAMTVIGIDDGEFHAPQPLVIDVHAGVPRLRACATDRIGDTIHYGHVRERLLRLLREHRVQLLEALAESVATILLDEFGARWVRVKIVKPDKFEDVRALGVQIERRAPQPAPRGAAVLHLIGRGMVPGQR
jgi:7,8-dihydroneopterin aldolase/epimerase/oxygenase